MDIVDESRDDANTANYSQKIAPVPDHSLPEAVVKYDENNLPEFVENTLPEVVKHESVHQSPQMQPGTPSQYFGNDPAGYAPDQKIRPVTDTKQSQPLPTPTPQEQQPQQQQSQIQQSQPQPERGMTVTPLHLLGDQSDTIDCPFCEHRAETKVVKKSSPMTQ